MTRKQYIHPNTIARLLETADPNGVGPVVAPCSLHIAVDWLSEGIVGLTLEMRDARGDLLREWQLPELCKGDTVTLKDLHEWSVLLVPDVVHLPHPKVAKG